MPTNPIPLRPLGRHSDVKVSALGLGGHHLGQAEDLKTAIRIVHGAIDGGVDSEIVLDQNLAIASSFKPMTAEERCALEDRCEFWAADGRFERFKTTTMYDGAIGREQHQYPEAQKLPA